MGSCCSKNASVGVKETIGGKTPSNGLIITENVGGLNTSSDLHTTNDHTGQSSLLPLIEIPQGVSTQETESINTYNSQDNSAARATLIFPSYSGYRNQDKFGIQKKTNGPGSTPTALVAPIQTNSSNLNVSTSPVDFVTGRASPLLSRYSPLLSPNSGRRPQPVGVFDSHMSNSRRGSVESGGFDSDLESENEELPLPNTIPDPDVSRTSTPEAMKDDETKRNEIEPQSEVRAANTTKTFKDAEVETEMFTRMVDASIGTDSDDVYRSKQTRQVQINLEKKPKMTSSISVGTEPVDVSSSSSNKLTSQVAKSPAVDSTNKPKAMTANAGTGTEKESFVQMVDTCVGTDSDSFYRSTKSTKIQVDMKKKSTAKTTSMAVGTDPVFTPEKSKKEISVGTDADPISLKHDTSTETSNVAYVKMIDRCVGTDSDDFFQSKKARKVKIDLKNTKKLKTSSMAIGTDSVIPSPKLSNANPKLTKKIAPKLKMNSPGTTKRSLDVTLTPTQTPNRVHSPKPEPHPIIETLENAFIRFARYGDINSEGLEMNNKNWAKLCRDCEFIDNKGVLVGDIDVIFSRHKPKGHRLIDFEMFLNCLNEVADRKFSKKVPDEWGRREIIYQRVIGKAPELVGITAISKTGNVNRMTDHNLYPVSHKMRFDEEGKGTGIEEKFEINDSQLGYVQGYKDRDTYELKLLGLTREKSGLKANNSKLASPRSIQRPLSSASSRS